MKHHMKKKLISLLTIAVLSALSASAQYRYNLYTAAGTGTNSTIGTNAGVTFDTTMDVASSSKVSVQFVFKLTSSTTNALPAGCTNPVVLRFDYGIDGTYWTNRFSWTNYANSNNVVIGLLTNLDVTPWAWFRLVDGSNYNNGIVTNYSVKVGGKVGL